MCDECVPQQQVVLGEQEGVPLHYLLGLCPISGKYARVPKQCMDHTSSKAWFTMDDKSASGILGNISRTAPDMWSLDPSSAAGAPCNACLVE